MHFKLSLRDNPINNEIQTSLSVGLALSEDLNVVLFYISNVKLYVILSLLMTVHNVPCPNAFLNLVFNYNYPKSLDSLKFFPLQIFFSFAFQCIYPTKPLTGVSLQFQVNLYTYCIINFKILTYNLIF
jgi:hypothetical protein